MASTYSVGTDNNVIALSRPDLENRIADAFTSELSSAQISSLIQEVDQADRAAKQASEQANETALDPATRPDAVAKARKEMEDADFTRRRMAKAAERLKQLLDQAQKRERNEENRLEFEAARAERDQLVEDLKEYPELLDKLTALILRVRDSDKRIERANSLCGSRDNWLHSAEFLACGSPENWMSDGSTDQPRLIGSRLIEITPKGGRFINLRT